MKSLFARRSSPRSLKPLVWASLPVLGLSVGVLASGIGIDLLLVAVSGLIMLTLERTLGDWMGERFGPVPATIGFSLVLAGFTWYVIASSNRFLDAAEARGYQGVYYRSATASAASVDSGSSSDGGWRGETGAADHRPHGSSGGAPTVTVADGPRLHAVPEEREEPKVSTPPAEASPHATPAQTSQTGVVSRIVTGARQPPPVGARTAVALSIEPPAAGPRRQVRIQASVTSGGRPLSEGVIEFVIDGVAFGRVAIDSRGMASTSYSSPYPGTYDVQARFLGTYRFQPSLSSAHTLKIVSK